MTEQELIALFERLGAHDAARWAHSEITEGIPQLARFLFLRQAWKKLIRYADHGWIREQENVDVRGHAELLLRLLNG
jgi:hypothetical protein